MDNRTRIKTYFEGFIKKTFPKIEIQNFLLHHPYRVKFFNNMCEELIKVEYARLRTFDVTNFKRVVEDMTRMFCQTAIEQKRQSILSDIQKSMETKKFEAKLKEDEEIDLAAEGIIEAKRDDSQFNTKLK